jgi:hypothetical protein
MDDFRNFSFFGLIAKIVAVLVVLYLIYEFIIHPLFG